MDFTSERHVRLYVRNTMAWRLLGWEGRAVWVTFYREADQAGAIGLGGLAPAQAAMLHGELPSDVAETGVARCLEQGWLVHDGDRLVIPRYAEANRGAKSGAQRMRECRERKRIAKRTVAGDETSQKVTTVTRSDVTRDKSSPFRVGHELMFEATGRQFGQEWRADLETIGSKPEAERRAAVPAIQQSQWCRANRTKVTPRHVLRMWDDYAAGAPPLQLVASAAKPPEPTELEKLYAKWQALEHARSACLYDEDAKKARLTAHMEAVSAQIKQLKGGINGRA